MPANEFNKTEHLTLLSSTPNNKFDSDKSILNDELNTNNVTKDKMDSQNNNFTSNDLWQSHNSLRDEQHRNEDRIAHQLSDSDSRIQKQLADSDSRLQKQLIDSEQRWDKRMSDMDTKWDKRMSDMESRLINSINNISSDVKHLETELRQDLRLMQSDMQTMKTNINGFASKKTVRNYAILLGIVLILGFIGSIIYINNTTPANAKASAEGATSAALNFVEHHNPISQHSSESTKDK